MRLVDDIIVQAAADAVPINTILRQALVLAHQLKNDRLKEWITAELNGYKDTNELPEYRVMRAFAKGLFIGSYGRQLNDQPIPRMEWPADLVVLYQDKFFPRQDIILNRAWQEIPRQSINGLNDTIRTKVLQFALELRDALGAVGDNLDQIPVEKIDRQVNYHIYGNNNVVVNDAKDSEIGSMISVKKNNIRQLAYAFSKIGINADDFAKLEHAIADDRQGAGGRKTIGVNTREWIANIGKTVGKEGLKVASNAAQAAALAWIKQHIG